MSYKDLLLEHEEEWFYVDANYQPQKEDDLFTNTYFFEEHEQYIEMADD